MRSRLADVKVTLSIIILNILIFLMEWLVSGNSVDFLIRVDVISKIEWGANFAPYTLGTDWWRLISSSFLHHGVIHLAANMFSLFALGRGLEREMGSRNFTVLYFLCGLGGAVVSTYWNLFLTSVGASGAIFGLFGFYIVWIIAANADDLRRILIILFSFFAYLFIITIAGQFFPLDNAGHFGGLFIGVLIGLLFVLRQSPTFRRKAQILIFSVLTILFIVTPRFQKHYFDLFQQVLSVDDRFRQVLSDRDNTDEEVVVKLNMLQKQIDSAQMSLNQFTSQIPAKLQEDLTIIKRIVEGLGLERRYITTLIERESYIYYDSMEHVRSNYYYWNDLHFPLRMQAAQPEVEEKNDEDDGPEVVKQYYDSEWRETSNLYEAKYYRLGFKDSLAMWDGPVRDYYLDGGIQMKGEYQHQLKNGVFLYYSEDSTYESAGRYKDDFKVGKWEYFYASGQLERELRYNNAGYLINYYDESGNLLVENGEGTVEEYYDNGTLKSYQFYREGRIDSVSYGYFDDGTLKYREYYDKGHLVSGKSRDKDGNTYNYDGSVQKPYPEGGLDQFWEYIDASKSEYGVFTNLKYTAEVTFTISEEGEVYDIRILKGDNPDFNAIAIKLVENGPKWIPAMQHGMTPVATEGWVVIRL